MFGFILKNRHVIEISTVREKKTSKVLKCLKDEDSNALWLMKQSKLICS
jgi:hypothetical protein